MSRAGYSGRVPCGRSNRLPSLLRSTSVRNGSATHCSPFVMSVADEPQRPNGILFQDQLMHFGPEASLLEVLHPAVRRDERVVRTEQHFGLELRVRVLHELRRKILR